MEDVTESDGVPVRHQEVELGETPRGVSEPLRPEEVRQVRTWTPCSCLRDVTPGWCLPRTPTPDCGSDVREDGLTPRPVSSLVNVSTVSGLFLGPYTLP